MAKDPICGMEVDEATAKYKTEHKGKTYYFCNESCKTTFDKNPAKFAPAQSCCSGHSDDCCTT
ncbi:YHS domain-containing protein [Candidatus Bathyarchaeota archaeon]|nr:YHS domain-containing protein [Candidatus Bathyarchaeota archaeon]